MLAELSMTPRNPYGVRCSPKHAGWWCRLLVAAFVALYLNYIPIHLATATHLSDLFAAVAHTVFDDHDHDHGDAEHDTDHHIPHPASDHALTIATQTQTSLPSPIVVVCVLAETSIFISEPGSLASPPVFERIRPPGESPPDPLQPRAPPLA
jgi:hypothetical protein